jgi:hypothetical protein
MENATAPASIALAVKSPVLDRASVVPQPPPSGVRLGPRPDETLRQLIAGGDTSYEVGRCIREIARLLPFDPAWAATNFTADKVDRAKNATIDGHVVRFEVVRHPGKKWNILIDGKRPGGKRPLMQAWALDLVAGTLVLEREFIGRRKKRRVSGIARIDREWRRLLEAAS